MNNIFKQLISFIILIVLLISCNDSNNNKTINIGVIVPLTGELASYGKNIQNGTELAVEKLRSDSIDVKLFIEDSQGETKAGISALQKLISANGCKYFIGDISSNVTLAMIPVIDNNKVFLFSPGAATPKLSNVSSYFARNWPSNNEEANSASEYAFNKLKYRNVCIVYVNNDWGIGLKENFEKKFKYLGGNIISNQIYEYGNRDFKTVLLKLKSLNADCIYLAGNQKEMGFFMKQFGENGLSFPIISNTTFLENDCLTVAGKNADGVIIPTPAYQPTDSTSKTVSDFYKAFKAKYNIVPTLVDANGYDAVMLIVKAIQLNGNNPQKVSEYIRNLNNYNGAGGLLNFHNGDVSIKTQFKKIVNGKPIVVK